jgi:hypothetical protein
MKKSVYGFIIMAVLAMVFAACDTGGLSGVGNNNNTNTDDFTAVTAISLSANSRVKNTGIDLNALAVVNPPNATVQSPILWAVADAGTTGVSPGLVAGGTVTPTAAGTLTLSARIAGGGENRADKIQNGLTIEVTDAHVPVTNIAGTLGTGFVGAALDLSGISVEPGHATYQTIAWSLAEDSVNADIEGQTIVPQAEGTLRLAATVAHGLGEGNHYTHDTVFETTVAAPDTTAPAQVTSLAGEPGDGQVTLTWADPADTDLDHIEITWDNGGTAPQTVAKETQTYTATGLANGTLYTFTAKAVDAAGNKSTGATATATPAAEASENLTANITFVKTGTDTSKTAMPSSYMDDFDNEGAGQKVKMGVTEQLTAYFAVNKAAGQTVTVDGADKNLVEAATGELDGSTPGVTLAVFAVDMGDLLFDKATIEDEALRTFSLKVDEGGKDPVTVAVTVAIKLEDTSASVYKRVASDTGRFGNQGQYVGTDSSYVNQRYTYVREANTAETGNKTDQTNAGASNAAELTAGRVTDLWNALAWVEEYAASGTDQSGLSQTPTSTEGFQEYRIFVKRGDTPESDTATMHRVIFKFANRDYVSVELYGAGEGGKHEVKITNKGTTLVTCALNYYATSSLGFFTIPRTGTGATYSGNKPTQTALILGKNITLWGGGNANPFTASTDNWYGAYSFVYLSYDVGVAFLRDHAKISGYYSAAEAPYPIMFGANPSHKSKFYMQGGSITGNTVNDNIGAIINSPNSEARFVKTGGTVTNNVTTPSNNNADKIKKSSTYYDIN